MTIVTESIPTPKLVSGQNTGYSHSIVDKVFGSDILTLFIIGLILLILGLFLKRFRLNKIRVNRLHRSAS
jgi:hypothetical protein